MIFFFAFGCDFGIRDVSKRSAQTSLSSRDAAMSRGLFPRVNVCWIAALLLAHLDVASAARAHTCSEVKTAFQLRQIGPLKWVPEAPATDVNLLVCKHVGPSCCTRKMEESYKVAATRDTVQNIKSFIFELKFLFLNHAAIFQDMHQSLFTFSQGHLSSLFESTYTSLTSGIAPHVMSLFSSLSNFIQDTSNISVDAAVYRFYDNLFLLVHNHIIKPGTIEDSDLSECLRATRQDVNPFGHHAQEMVKELAGAMQAARALTRAFSMGEDLMNITEVAPLTNECTRALLKMQYCPHCQGLTLIRPCPEFCLNVMRGCFANMAELDIPWRHYVAILEDLTQTIVGDHGLELALLGIREHVNNAILHAQQHEARISATVDKVCGHSLAENQSTHPTTVQMIPTVTLAAEPTTNQTDYNFMKQLGKLSDLRREFMKHIVGYKAFFAALPEMLCEGEVVRDEPSCWGGNDVVDSYKGRVVGIGVLAQRQNPEVKVRGPDAMLAAVKERLGHFNQDIQQHMPGMGQRDSWDLGSGEDSSGECDDEDGCQGSGEGTTKSSNTDSSVDTEVVVKSPPHEAPVGRSKPKLRNAAHLVLPSFTTLILILGQQWTLN
ncbi:glypican-5 isoform X2 [Hemibagrus wyckioides]|uniref:glypican-5 isoform X2 n=1 Tax=Hemibagrus wyckioides TaxID=337641 RepID=UPI00266BA8AA|nr:glypican-5 isoform X2 [Hemibagrus wyckioides]